MQILILGANSDIAYAVAKKFAKEKKASIYLASRGRKLLAKKAKDLQVRYQVKATPIFFDALDFASHQKFYENLNPKPDLVIVAFGHYGDQVHFQQNFVDAKTVIDCNYTGAVSILEIVAADFEARNSGTIIGISSVAGDRGRQSNYIYGSAKSAFSCYLSGLRNRVSKKNIQVMTVLPGYTDTKMTEGLELPGILTAKPDEVARDIYKAFKKKKDIIYTKWFWKFIMLIIKTIPESIFKRLSL